MRAVETALRPIKAKLAARTVTEEGSNWKGSLLQSIVDNLQVKIHNVHLRLEDTTLLRSTCMDPRTDISAGLFFHTCQVYTTDEEGNATTAKESSLVYKQIVLRGFAVYAAPDHPESSGAVTPRAIPRRSDRAFRP